MPHSAQKVKEETSNYDFELLDCDLSVVSDDAVPNEGFTFFYDYHSKQSVAFDLHFFEPEDLQMAAPKIWEYDLKEISQMMQASREIQIVHNDTPIPESKKAVRDHIKIVEKPKVSE